MGTRASDTTGRRGTTRLTAFIVGAGLLAGGAACSSSKTTSVASAPPAIAVTSSIAATTSNTSTPTASPTPTTLPTPTGSTPGTTGSTTGTTGSPTADLQPLTQAGIRIIADEGAPIELGAALTITEVQAGRMAADVAPGAGLLGRDIDALAPVTPGTPPASYLLAAWVSTGTSPAAGTARGWMGNNNWKAAPSLHFPVAVLAMFVNEMATATNAEMPPAVGTQSGGTTATQPAGRVGTPIVFMAAPTPGTVGPCSAVTGFLDSVINGLFDALRIQPSASGGGPFDFLASALAAVWNVAISLAQAAVQGLVTILTAPVFEAMRLAVGALGVATTIVSYFKDQTLDVNLAAPQADKGQYPFAVGAAADVTGQFIAKGHELTGDWPPALVDCAKVAGATLPQLLKPGIPTEWTVDDGGVIVPGQLTGTVTADRTATLDFVTGRETEEDAKGETVFGDGIASVKIPRKEIDDFLDLARAQVTGARDKLLARVPAGAARDAATSVFAATIDPTVTQLTGEISGAIGGVFSLSGSAVVIVQHHTPPDTTTSSSKPPPSQGPPNSGNQGDFCAQYKSLIDWVAANPPGDVVAWASEIVRRLTGMQPAPSAVSADVDVELGVYTAVAASANVQVLIQKTLPLGNAAKHIGAFCGLG